MIQDRGPFDWNTWMWWISLTALSNTTAVVLISIVITVLGVPIFGATGAGESASMALQIAMAPLFFLAGTVVGAGQWIVLRGQIIRAGWWVLATAAGWMAGYLWSYLLFPPGGDNSSFVLLLLPWVLFGLATGLCQWLILRHFYHRAGLWVPVATLAMAIGATGWLVGGLFGGAFLWLFAAAFSGWFLLRVLPPKRLWPETRARGKVEG